MLRIGPKFLLFLAVLIYFAPMKKFDAVSAFLADTDWNALFTMTFADVCRRFDADPRLMDNLMYDTFGMSGDEIIEQYRKGLLIFNSVCPRQTKR